MNQKLTPLSGARFSTAEDTGGFTTARKSLISTSMLRRASALLMASLLGVLVALPSMAQVTTNSGSGLAASYPTLADAITALNAATISSPVTITLTGDETAPAGGYAITASGDATNTIVIEGSSSTISASPSHTVGAINDAIFKIIGGDYITIRNFTMQENGANLVNTPAGSNTMTEFGVALFYAAATNGCQNITIHNNSISLNRTYTNTFGIYANSTHTATSMTASATATGSTGGNHNLSITSNNISNVNQGIVVVGPTGAADQNTNIIIGGSSGNANTFSNYGTAAQLSSFINVSGTINGVLIRNTTGYTISHNSFTSSAGGVTTGTLRGVFNPSNSAASTGTFTNNVNNNSFALEGGAAAVVVQGINLETSTASVTSTLNINNNNFTTLNHTSATASAAITGIINTGPHLNININSNTFTNITSKTTGSFTFISNSVTLPAGGVKNVNSNSIVTAFSKTGAGGTVTLFTDNGSDPIDATNNVNNNDFSNITVTGATTVSGILNTNGGSPIKNVTGNTLSNWTCGTSAVTAMSINFDGGTSTVTNNNINNISAGGAVTALIFGTSGTGTTNASGNTIHTITSTGATAVTGITVGGASTGTRNIFKNKVYGLSSTSASTGTVLGMTLSSGANLNVYNNFIGNLTASSASGTDVIRGISITSTTTSSNVNVSFNTVFINASSTGINFGTTGIFHTASATATTASLSLRNNIIVNNSTANGTGLVVAFRRSSGAANTLNNYNSVSNNNLFYAGTPGAANLIYGDGTSTAQTMSAYKAGTFTAGTIAPRDALSFSENVTFQSTTGSSTDFLKIDASVATQIESGATPIAGITDDFFGTTRNSTNPDVGAHEDELTGLDLTPPSISYTALANTASTTNRTLSATISDPSGVPTSGAGLPVLYWNVNNGSFNSATAVHQSGNTFNFSFGNGVGVGDVVRYYIVAQDEAGTPNIGAFPSAGAASFTADPPAVGTAPTTPSSYTIAPAFSGTYAIGAGETYTSLTDSTGGFFRALNEGAATGNIILEITSDLTETGQNALNQIADDGNGYTLTIRPSDAVMRTISGSFAGGLIRLNGADRVTIDGRHSGSGQFFTIRNNSTDVNTAAIYLASLGAGAGASNNTIRNCIIEAGSITVTSTFAIHLGGSSISTTGLGADNDNNTIQDNIIRKAFYGIYAVGATSTAVLNNLTITGNTIGSSTSTDVIANRGIQVGNGENVTISGNTIFGFRNTNSTIQTTGIELSTNVTNAKITANGIYDLVHTGTSFRAGQGISVNTVASSNVLIANNVIYGLGGHGSATASNNSWGIIILGGGGINVHYNSINQTATFGNTNTNIHGGIYVGAGATTLNITNNIVASQASFGVFYNIYSLAANSAFSSLNHNSWFIPSTTATNTTRHIGFITSARTTLADWQTATSLEANSQNADPLLNGPSDLRPQPGSPLLAAGSPVAGTTVDFLGGSRSGSTPSIGAYENGADAQGPQISYTAFGNISTFTARTLTASISDVSGVPTAGAGLPVLYWRVNSGSWSSATGAHVSGNNYEFSFGAGVSLADTIRYYMVAQDLVSTPNVSAFPAAGASGFSASPPAVSTPPTTPSSYIIVGPPLAGDYNVGVGGDYTTITAATNDLNLRGVSGAVRLLLTDTAYTTTETYPITFTNIAGISSTNTVSLMPASGVTARLASSQTANAIIRLQNISNIIIDGRQGGSGTSQSLTITNSANATAGHTIVLIDGSTNNTIRDVIITNGGAATAGNACILMSTSASNASGNSNNNIINNLMEGGRSSIFESGTDVNLNNNNVYEGNTFRNFGFNGFQTANCSNIKIRNNVFTTTTPIATANVGISIGASVSGIIDITGNRLEDIQNTAVTTVRGISASPATGATLNIHNNVLIDNTNNGTKTSNYLMQLAGSNQYTANVHFNSFYLGGSHTGGVSGNIVSIGFIQSNSNASTVVNFSNNAVRSVRTGGDGLHIGAGFSNVTGTINANNNVYFSNGGATSFHALWSTTAYNALATYQGVAGTNESNTQFVNPNFVSSTNLRPLSISALLGNGTTVSGITTDFAGATRSLTTPTIGAFEGSVINTWTGTGTWTTGGNWSLGTPASGDHVLISSGTVEATSAGNTINGITVNSGATVTIPNGASLTVNGALTNNGTFTVQNGGHLLQGGSATIGGSGTFNATRNSANTSNLVYNMWSSPNSTSTLGNLGGTDWYLFNSATQAWSNTGLTSSSVLSAGRGYSSTGAGNVTFTGTFNNGAVSPEVGTSGQGWNLVGNPYPSSVSGTSFLAGNTNIDGTLWFWSQPTAATVGNSGGDYATWTTAGGTAGTAGGATPDGNIGLAQGFFVKANSGSTVSFTNSMRSANAGSNFRLGGERAWFNLTGGNNLFNQILLGFSSGASDQRDPADGTKLKGNTQIAFYSLLGADQLAIQAMAERGTATRIVPVGFDVATAGAYSLALDRTESMPANVDIFLKDNLTGSMHNLRNQAYGFAVTNAGSFTNRFEIHFGVGLATSVNNLTAEQVRIFGAGQSLFVQGFAEGTVVERFEVRDAAGRLVMELNRPQNADLARMEMNVAAGVYLARIVTNNGIKTERVYLSK